MTDRQTDRQTDGQTDICIPRAAFAAENDITVEIYWFRLYFVEIVTFNRHYSL